MIEPSESLNDEDAELIAQALKREVPNRPAINAGVDKNTLIGGRYRRLRKLGQGTYGAVYSAADTATPGEPIVVVKVLHEALAERPDVRRRFEREIEVVAELDHPSIVRLLDRGEHGVQPYLVLEYVEGKNLSEHMHSRASRGDIYTIPEIVDLFAQLCDALELAHARNIVHRDLKPGNILVAGTRGALRPKVIDFGLVKLLDDLTGATTHGRVSMLGTLLYLAPEQKMNIGVDRRTDVFALGCILFELLTLRRTWARDVEDHPLFYGAIEDAKYKNTVEAVLQRIEHGPRPIASRWRPGLPRAVDAVVLRALDPQPEARFQSAKELQRALQEALGMTARRAARKEPTYLMLAAIAAVAFCFALGVIVYVSTSLRDRDALYVDYAVVGDVREHTRWEPLPEIESNIKLYEPRPDTSVLSSSPPAEQPPSKLVPRTRAGELPPTYVELHRRLRDARKDLDAEGSQDSGMENIAGSHEVDRIVDLLRDAAQRLSPQYRAPVVSCLRGVDFGDLNARLRRAERCYAKLEEAAR